MPPVFFNPLHSKIDNIPLIHQPDGGIAKLNGGEGIRLLKILAVYEQRFVCLPDSFAVFKYGAVFCTGVLPGISCTRIC